MPAVAATAAGRHRGRGGHRNPPHDARSRGDCGHVSGWCLMKRHFRLTMPAVAATAAFLWATGSARQKAASRCPQSRRLRRRALSPYQLSACPPHDARSRGDCGSSLPTKFGVLLSASRCPQSRRLRLKRRTATERGRVPPHDARSRGDCGLSREEWLRKLIRLTMPAVAATAARLEIAESSERVPPHDARSRGDCGQTPDPIPMTNLRRLTMPAVAATAAHDILENFVSLLPASRCPQSRRLRLSPQNPLIISICRRIQRARGRLEHQSVDETSRNHCQ